MEIRFKNTRRDVFAFFVSHTMRSPYTIIFWMICIAAVSLSRFQECMAAKFSISSIIDLVSVVLVLIVIISITTTITFLITIFNKKNKNFLLETTLTFNADEIRAVQPLGTSAFNWKLIQRIRQNKKYIFIYISASQALIIPKRTFASKEEAVNFFEYIARTWKANTTT